MFVAHSSCLINCLTWDLPGVCNSIAAARLDQTMRALPSITVPLMNTFASTDSTRRVRQSRSLGFLNCDAQFHLNKRNDFRILKNALDFQHRAFEVRVRLRMPQAQPDAKRRAIDLLKRSRRCQCDAGLCGLRQE